ncbi:GIY-YIG nuclease family protein [bacterium]|nr:GIY-YIG nuclease family protein [bacterium]
MEEVKNMIISGYSFEGPYVVGKKVINRAAIYVILDSSNVVVDVGQSGQMGTRLLNHERKPCWDRHGGKWFAVKWMPSDRYSREDRERIEHEIRLKEKPFCGER